MEYATGDHLGVLPRNNVDLIRRVLARFNLDAGTYVTINPTGGGSYTHLPLGEPAPLLGILGSCVELQDMASRSDLAVLARYAGDPDEQAELEAMSALDEAGPGGVPRAGRGAAAHGAGPARSVPQLRPAVRRLPRPAAPAAPPLLLHLLLTGGDRTCHLTVGVLRGPARSGEGEFCGVASGHLEAGMEGSTVFTFVRKPTIPFRPPANPHVPMIMVGAGTGMAPFRGFLQERADLKDGRARRSGSRSCSSAAATRRPTTCTPTSCEAFEAGGVTELQVAFSREPDQPRTYVQQLIERERDHVWDLMAAGAVIYVCGNASTMAPGVRAALTDMFKAKTGGSDEAAEEWLAGLRSSDRYLEDIWGEMAVAV